VAPANGIPPHRVSAQELSMPDALSGRRLRRRIMLLVAIGVVIVSLITLLPGLSGLRDSLERANPAWLAAGVLLKLASGLGYVAVFRVTFCRRMNWRVSTEVGMSELGANAVLPAGGAGGLALGAWALKRGGMANEEIARRTAAFFMLTSVANFGFVVLVGAALATGLLSGESNLLLTALPALLALAAIAGALLAGRAAPGLHERVRTAEQGPARRSTLVWKTLSAVADGVNEAVSLLREHDFVLIAGILAYLIFDLLVLWTSFKAFGATPSLAIITIAYLLGELGGLIPVPGGIGGVDAGLVGALVLYGVALTPATSAVLAYRATFLWVPAVTGAIAFGFLRRTLSDEARAAALCSSDTEMEIIGLGRVVIGPGPPSESDLAETQLSGPLQA
jgi:uncharacterized protein (TIRG00374 family)